MIFKSISYDIVFIIDNC